MPYAGNNTLPRLSVPATHHPPNNSASHLFPIKKALQALSRDARLFLRRALRHRPCALFYVLLIIAVLLSVLLLAFPYAHVHPQNRRCACIGRKSSRHFASLLTHASFVARVQLEHTSGPNVTFHVHTLFHGPFSAAKVPLILIRKNIAMCGWMRRSTNWLLIAGNISPIDAEHSAATLAVIPGKAEHCGSRVWLFPWKRIPDDLKAILSGAGGEGGENAFSNALQRAGDSHPQNTWISSGISIVAACKGRADTLKAALASWIAASDIDEIVLVDWGSEPTLASTLPVTTLKDTRIVIVRVDAQKDWILTRAYNLALQAVSRSQVLKVDCDTILGSDFVTVHPLSQGTFYAGNWNALNAGPSNALHANGVLFSFRDDIFSVGAYDERVVTYGWDDTDLFSRLSHRLTARTIRYDSLHHIPHPPHLRSAYQQDNKVRTVLPADHPFCAAVEVQRNRLLLTRYRLPVWSKNSPHVRWAARLVPKDAVYAYNAFSLTEVPPAISLVSSADAVDASKRAIRVILRRYGTRGIPRSLSLAFIIALSEKVAAPDRYADVLFSLRGGCAARILALASASVGYGGGGVKRLASSVAPPAPYEDWRLRFLWRAPSFECTCGFYTTFAPLDAEILSTWDDVENPVSNVPFSVILNNATSDARSVLANFTTLSQLRNLSTSLRAWWPPTSLSNTTDTLQRSLVTDLLCDSTLRNATVIEVGSTRSFLRALVPSSAIASTVVNSLNSHDLSILDEPALRPHEVVGILGTTRTTAIHSAFDEPYIVSFAAQWSGASAISNSPFSVRLVRRARVLVVASFISKQVHAGQLSDISITLRNTALSIARRVNALLRGCDLHASDYLEMLPELSLILAALISADVCR